MNLTHNEIEVMDVFWDAGKPLSRAELLNLSVDKSWKSNSVHILLNSLLKKGALREAGFVRSGKTYGRTFEPAVTCEEYHASTICTTTKNQPNLPELLAALLRMAEVTPEDLDQMEEVICQRRSALSQGNDRDEG